MAGKSVAVQVTGYHRQYRKPIFVMELDGEERRTPPTTHFSLALAEVTDGKAVLLVPESLAVGLARDADDLEEMIRDERKLEERLLEEIGGREEVEVRAIPSSGSFSGKDGLEVRYETDPDLIQISLFSVFVELLDEGYEVFFDVSSGLNVYPAMGVRALYSAATHLLLGNLYGLLIGKYSAPNIWIAFYGQVSSDGEEVRVKLERVEPQIMKDFPLAPEDTNKGPINQLRVLCEFSGMNRENVRGVRHVISEGFRAFNCLVLNTPLPLYVTEPDEIICLLDDREISKLERYLLGAVWELTRGRKVVERSGSRFVVRREAKLEFRSLTRVLGALAATRSLMRMIGELRKSMRDGWVPLSSIRRFFLESVYRDGGYRGWFRLNRHLLENELERIEEAAATCSSGEPKPLMELLGIRGSQGRRRNFFSHSGFLADVTEVRKDEGGEVLVRYSPCASRKGFNIRDWLTLR
ncbi:MAG: TM1812 family CRISPR-associated protein [Candidatus Caldarchaeales archaeon]